MVKIIAAAARRTEYSYQHALQISNKWKARRTRHTIIPNIPKVNANCNVVQNGKNEGGVHDNPSKRPDSDQVE